MAGKKGAGSAGDSVGSASVEIRAELVIENEEEIAQIAANAAGQGAGKGGGAAKQPRDTAPKSVSVDAKVNTQLNRDVAKDVQAALDRDEFQLTIDTANIREQIQRALRQPFDVVINAEVQGAQRAAAVGASPSASVMSGAPQTRAAIPPEITELLRRQGKKGMEQAPFVGGINAVYRNINEMLQAANKPRFGTQALEPGNEVEKALEMVDQFGDKLGWFSTSGPLGKLTGGSVADFLKSQGIEVKGSALEANVGAFGGDNQRSSDIFFTRLQNWARDNPVQAQPAAAPEQVAQNVANAVAREIQRRPDTAAEERAAAAGQRGVEIEKEEQAAAQRDIQIRPVDPRNLPATARPLVARDRREDDQEAEARARQQLGGRNRANVRRLRGRGEIGRLSTVGAGAGTEVDLEPFLRVAEMGGFENIWEQFTGKKFNESQGLFQFSPTDPESLGELGRLSKLKPGPKRQIAGQEGKFQRVMPTEAFIRSVAMSVMPKGTTEVPGETMDEVRALVERNIEDVRKAIGQGQSPLQGVRETRRGQGGTHMVASGDLGRRLQKFDEWIGFLDDRIEQTSGYIERVNTALAKASKRRDTRKVQELEEVSRAASAELQRYDAGLAQAIEDRKEIAEGFGTGITPDQARINAAAQALQGAENRGRIDRGEGLKPEQKATKAFKASAGGRMRDVLMAMGFPEREGVVGTEIVNALTQRFLEDPNRITPTGDLRTGTAQMRQVAFGPKGRPGRGAQAGGLLGELMGMVPGDVGRTQQNEIRETLTSFLQGVVGNEGFMRGLLEEDVKRRDNMARLRPITGNAEKGEIFHGLTGEGQFRFAPGQQAALEADIATNRARAARIAELEGILRPSRETIRPAGPGRTTESGEQFRVKEVAKTVYNPDRRYSSANVEKMIQELDVLKGEFKDPDVLQKKLEESLARQQLEASELAGSQQTRIKTLGRGKNLTGEQSRDIARGMGITMDEEAPVPPFAAFAEKYAGAAGGAGVGGGAGGGGGGGRGRVPAGGGGEEGGFPDITGPIHVIVDNWPAGLSGGVSHAGATPGQQGIASASRASWAMADIGAQTSPEAQDEFRRMSERLVGEGMTAKDVRKMAERAGLGPAAAMYYGRGPQQPPAGGGGEPPVYGPPLPPGMGGPGEYGKNFPKLNYIPDPKSAPLSYSRRLVPLPTTRISTEQRAAERARQTAALDADAEFKAIEQFRQSEARQAADAKRVERQREADIRSARRLARVNNPIGFAQERDIADTSLASLRGQNRAIQRRVPRRGFGASVTDLLTSIIGGGALERQLESADRAQREVTEINQAAERRSSLRTERRGVAQQLLAAQPGSEQAKALANRFSELTGNIVAQNKIIKISTKNFEENAAIVRKNTAAAFGAAAVGSIGSIGVGAITFGLGSAIVAPIITAVAEGVSQGIAPAIERASGFAATTGRITSAAADEIRARGGDTGAVAGVAARTGLAAPTFGRIGGLITDRARVEAGNKALQEQIDLIHTAENLSRDRLATGGVERGLISTTGGAFGTPLFGIPSTQELLVKELGGIPDLATLPGGQKGDRATTDFGTAIGKALINQYGPASIMGGGGVAPKTDFGAAFEEATGEIKQGADRLDYFNEQAAKGGSSLKLLAGNADEVAKSVKLAKDAGLFDLASTLEAKGLQIQGAGTSLDVQSFLAAINRGATTPDVNLLLQDTARQRQVAAEQRRASLTFGLGQVPIQAALQFAQRPFSDASAGIAFGPGDRASTQKKLNAELAVTQKMYDDINKEVKSGMDEAVKFVQYGADIFGTGQMVGGLGAEAAADFAHSLKLVYDYGKQISQIEIGLQTKQAAYQAAQFSYQIGIAKRNLADAKGLAGQLTDAGKDNLGVLEREQFLLQRRAQSMQMALAQRQINFQRAIAGFTAPGLTGEERAARIEQAKIEADYAQKQLNIQKELFGLQGRSFQITASRQVTDLVGQLGLLERGRTITLETAAAEKKIRALTYLQEKENAKVQKYYQAAIEATNAIAGEIAELASAANKAMVSVANDVIREYTRVINTITAQLNGAGRSTTTDTGKKRATYSGRAAGGGVEAGETAWVGEAGKELVTFGSDAYVTPNHLISPMGGSVNTTNITIMVTGNHVTSEDELTRLEARITEAVEKAQSRKISLLGGRSY